MVIQKSVEVSKSKKNELIEKLQEMKNISVDSFPLYKKGTICVSIVINECDNKEVDQIINSVINQTELFG